MVGRSALSTSRRLLDDANVGDDVGFHPVADHPELPSATFAIPNKHYPAVFDVRALPNGLARGPGLFDLVDGDPICRAEPLSGGIDDHLFRSHTTQRTARLAVDAWATCR